MAWISPILIMIFGLILACSSSQEKSSQEKSAGNPPTPFHCEGPNCEGFGLMAATVSAIRESSPDPAKKKDSNSIILKCHFNDGNSSLPYPCGSTLTKVNEENFEITASGETITIPRLNPTKTYQVTVSLKGCRQPKTLKDLSPGQIYPVQFQWPCP